MKKTEKKSNLKRYASGKSVAMVDDRHAIITVPAVELHTPAAAEQDLVLDTKYKCKQHIHAFLAF